MRRHPAGHQAVIRVMAQARKDAGLSQRQLSVKLKEPVNFIHRIESGERDVGVTEFITIARIIGSVSQRNMKVIGTNSVTAVRSSVRYGFSIDRRRISDE